MSCKEETREIDGKSYFCRQWDATKAITNQMKLLQTFKGAAVPFVDGDFTLANTLALMQSADPSETLPVIKEFVCRARVDGTEVTTQTFDFQYSGNLMLILKVFAFVCEVQYKGFFEEGLALTKAQAKQDPKQSSETTES